MSTVAPLKFGNGWVISSHIHISEKDLCGSNGNDKSEGKQCPDVIEMFQF